MTKTLLTLATLTAIAFSAPVNATTSPCYDGTQNCPAAKEKKQKAEAKRKKDAANPNSPYGKSVKTSKKGQNNSGRRSGKVIPE